MVAVGIVLTIKDGKGKSSTQTVYVKQDGSSFSSYIKMARQWAEAIGDTITGKIERIGVFADIPVPSNVQNINNSSTAEPESDVEEGAKIFYNTAGGFKGSFRIPTFSETLIVDGTKQVDLSDSRLTAIMGLLEDGLNENYGDLALPSLIDMTDYREDDIVTVENGREHFSSDRG